MPQSTGTTANSKSRRRAPLQIADHAEGYAQPESPYYNAAGSRRLDEHGKYLLETLKNIK